MVRIVSRHCIPKTKKPLKRWQHQPKRIISLASGKICYTSGTVRDFILQEVKKSEIVEINSRYDMGFLTFRKFYYQTITTIKEHIQEFSPADYRIVY